MLLVEKMRKQIVDCMKNKNVINERRKDVLRVVLGEVDTNEARSGKKYSDEDVQKVIRKVMQSNQETMDLSKNELQKEKLKTENECLNEFLPKVLSEAEIESNLIDLFDTIKATRSEGQATGLAIKYLKQKQLVALSEDVAKVVKKVRA